MCGIFSYYGTKKNAPEIVINGLKRLEYRGYDSWGIAYKNNSEISIYKETGKISDFKLEKKQFKKSDISIGEVEEQDIAFQMAIGHSRWATHGKVNKINSHPHFTENKNIVLVHNGIFENYLEIKNFLKKRNHKFLTETDSEVIAHLMEEHEKTHSFIDSVKLTMKEMDGRYAFVVINKNSNKMIAARKGSPLIIGVKERQKEDEFFIASDIPAFLPHTNKVYYLDDNQVAIIENGNIEFFDNNTNETIEKRIIKIDIDTESAEKGEYPHFMIKEIMEQKDTLNRSINQDENQILKVANEINKASGIYIVGCGTAGKVGMVAEFLFAKIAEKNINFKFGSEFASNMPFLTDKTLVIAISQSGETADTLEAIEKAKEKGAKIISIVNVESSTMARISDIVIPIKAGPEKAVASTKATTSQIAILTLLAYACADKLNEGKHLLINTASQINDMLNPRYEKHIMKIAKKIANVESMYIIGRNINYPMALEAAIKLQEVSYIHAEGFAAGELKHGPIALISKNTPVIALVSKDEYQKETLSNAMEIKSRGGYIIGVSPQNEEIFDFWIRVPETGNASPIVNIIPVQILAYQLAILKQNDPDKPRNLAKSVTVK